MLRPSDARRVAAEAMADPQARLEPATADPGSPAGHRYAFARDVVAEVDRRKRERRLLDFDDLLLHTAAALEEHRTVAEEFRERYRCFVVDEYQDVTALQQRVLDAWLGGRDDLTVVGDANQPIYTFAGASPRHLLDFPRRYRDAVVVRLTRDYRSTPQVVSTANTLIGTARGRVGPGRPRSWRSSARWDWSAGWGRRPTGPTPRRSPATRWSPARSS